MQRFKQVLQSRMGEAAIAIVQLKEALAVEEERFAKCQSKLALVMEIENQSPAIQQPEQPEVKDGE